MSLPNSPPPNKRNNLGPFSPPDRQLYPDHSRPPTPQATSTTLRATSCPTCAKSFPDRHRSHLGRPRLSTGRSDDMMDDADYLTHAFSEHHLPFESMQDASTVDYGMLEQLLASPEPRINEAYEQNKNNSKQQTRTRRSRRDPSPTIPHHHMTYYLRYLFYSNETGALYAPTLESLTYTTPTGQVLKIDEMLKNTRCWWLDVCAPTEKEMKLIAKVFRMHPLTTEDILTEDAREKCEVFRRYYFVNYRTFESRIESDRYLEPVNVCSVVSRQGIMSFHFQPTPHARNVLRRIRQLKDSITVTPDWINYALLDDITDTFVPLISDIQLEADTIDDLVLLLNESEQTDMLRRIGTARKRVMTATRLLAGKADVVKALIKRCEEWVAGDIRLYLGDIQDHVLTMLQNANHCEQIVSRAHSNYLAHISIELTQSSNRTNDVVAKLTILASLIVPMNLVTGLWGMNVHVPGQEDASLVWFFSIVACFVWLGFLIFIWLRKSDVL